MGLQMGPRLKMTKKTKILLAINNTVYGFYRFINSWAFEHMDKESSGCVEKSRSKTE
jgi:hypothetical protein